MTFLPDQSWGPHLIQMVDHFTMSRNLALTQKSRKTPKWLFSKTLHKSISEIFIRKTSKYHVVSGDHISRDYAAPELPRGAGGDRASAHQVLGQEWKRQLPGEGRHRRVPGVQLPQGPQPSKGGAHSVHCSGQAWRQRRNSPRLLGTWMGLPTTFWLWPVSQ